MPLVAGVARMYRNTGAVNRIELMQEGVVGLLRALERFDPERGTPFWGYASFWVRQAMQQLVAELTRPVVLSDRALRQLARVKQARRDHLQAHKSEPSTSDLSDRTGIAREQIERLVAVERQPRSIEEPIGDERGRHHRSADARRPGCGGRLCARGAPGRHSELGGLPDHLGSREREIVQARFGLDGHAQTLRELAGTLELSAERVRQIEEEALEKLGAPHATA